MQYFSEYSNVQQCPHCGNLDYHFVKPFSSYKVLEAYWQMFLRMLVELLLFSFFFFYIKSRKDFIFGALWWFYVLIFFMYGVKKKKKKSMNLVKGEIQVPRTYFCCSRKVLIKVWNWHLSQENTFICDKWMYLYAKFAFIFYQKLSSIKRKIHTWFSVSLVSFWEAPGHVDKLQFIFIPSDK